MKLIEPYINVDEAILSLDNGGRFYNFFTEAEDGVISQAEIGKVAGLFNDRQKTVLFFELSISNLDAAAKADVISKMDENLQRSYEKYKPQELLPSEAESKGVISSNAIITGFPVLIESKSELTGFILIPISTGKAMTFIPIPIIDHFDVYRMKDELSSETFLIAHAKNAEKLTENKRIKVAGVLKEFKIKKGEADVDRKYLEINYFINKELI